MYFANTLPTCLAVVAVFATLCSQLAHADNPLAQPPAMTSEVVSSEYSQIGDAVVKRDLDRIMSFFTNDFTEVNAEGRTINVDQERKEYQSRFEMIKSMTCTFDVQSTTPCSEGEYCDVTIHLEGIGVKRVMFMKFQAPFTNELVVHDLWIDTPDGWKLKSRTTLKDKTVVQMN